MAGAREQARFDAGQLYQTDVTAAADAASDVWEPIVRALVDALAEALPEAHHGYHAEWAEAHAALELGTAALSE